MTNEEKAARLRAIVQDLMADSPRPSEEVKHHQAQTLTGLPVQELADLLHDLAESIVQNDMQNSGVAMMLMPESVYRAMIANEVRTLTVGIYLGAGIRETSLETFAW